LKPFIASINFDLLRYYILPVLIFVALLLIFTYIVFEKRERQE